MISQVAHSVSSGWEVQGKSPTMSSVSPWGWFCHLLEENYFSGRVGPRVCLKLAQKRLRGRELRQEHEQPFEISNKGRQGRRAVCQALRTAPSPQKGLSVCCRPKKWPTVCAGECRPTEYVLTERNVSPGAGQEGLLGVFSFES